MMNVITLCSGYDSQCMGLDRLGIEYNLVAWGEFDPESKQLIDKQPAVIAHNAVYPQYKDRNVGDITKVDWTKIKQPIDLLFYSTPCQSISNAGLQHGLKKGSGTRSSIIWNVLDAIDTLHPKYLIMENVKALVSKKFINDFNDWLRALEERGYHNKWQVLNAKNYGIPQNRERVFVISSLEEVEYEFPKPFTLEKKLNDILEEEVDDKYYLSKRCIDGFNKHNQNHFKKGTGFVFKPKDPTRDDYASCIRANAALCPTDNTIVEYAKSASGEDRIRRLTPRECFRLMGVSEENINRIQAAGISNSQQYKMAGNSIVVDVLYYIFKELFYGERKGVKKEPVQLSLF